MTNDEMSEMIIKCLKPLFQKGEEPKLDSNLLEIGMDSMNFIRLVVNLEEEFNIEISDDQIVLENFSTVENICSVIRSLI